MAENKLPQKKVNGNFIDITGQRFGLLVALSRAEKPEAKLAWWLCQCDCGNRKVITGNYLRSGHTRSCGCLRSVYLKKASFRHGKRHAPEYTVWKSMKQRCHDPNGEYYSDYGGRGIFVSEAWRSSFQQFLADMGPRPTKKHQIERINNNGPYSKDNCKWALSKDQNLNKRNTNFVVIDDKPIPLLTVAAQHGIAYGTLRARLKRSGWTIEKALSTPPAKGRWHS